ncbi:hypothetical protein SBOR_1774 [Sclerotinia borealis F-4128]|uniref:Uncharacterized protein n=1 Tax=Sclerotinia borealis (strain F-4128) TaxID=1432307 RepID=W9CTF3_SCLBF|nr:hypothetical protein SBOR_1774 [Sclerotinia borealis F-4128]
MSVHPKLPLYSGLAASSAAAASTEVEQESAIKSREAEFLDEANASTTVAHQKEHESGSISEGGSDSKSDNTTATGTRSQLIPPPKTSNKSTTSPDATISTPDHALNEMHFTRPNPSPTCAFAPNHLIGQFCFYCRGIKMPWGDRHPIALDTSGNTIRIAPQGTLLEGIRNLTEPYEITELALLIEFRIESQSLSTELGHLEALQPFPELHDAACRIADLVQELTALAYESERERLPHWFDVLHELLKEPTLTRDQYFVRAIREWNLQPANTRARQFKAPPAANKRNDKNILKSSGRLDLPGRRNSVPSTTPHCSDEGSDIKVYDSNEEDKHGEPSFRKLPKVKKNTRGVNWRFVEGSDLENAEVGKPDPSKFYLTRENIDDPKEVDVRQFSHIAGFDWNNPQNVHDLNKARAQNLQRVLGNIAKTRVPWTQLEKACLVEEVQEAIKSGLNRQTIDWNDIAARLKTRFEGVPQKKGSKLAPGVEREPKDGKKDKTLKTSRSDRTGYNRSGSATETQALKYPDILQMVNNASGIGGKGGRGVLRDPRRSLSQMIDEEKDEVDDRPTKKKKSASCSFSNSPPPREFEKHDDGNDDDGSSYLPMGHPALKTAFALKFTKRNAKQFDAKSNKN